MASDPIARFLADTSVFMQCDDLSHVTWNRLTHVEDIEVYLCQTVLHEIDKHKSSREGRLQRKARALTPKINALLDSDEATFRLRDRKPKVALKLMPSIDDKDTDAIERFLSADRRIVEEARIALRSISNLRILTCDVGMQAAARNRGVPFSRAPDEWLLPPETDPKTKQIEDLLQRVSKLESDTPALSLQIDEMDSGGSLTFDSFRTDDLPKNQIPRLGDIIAHVEDEELQELRDRLEEQGNSQFGRLLGGVTREQVQNRQDAIRAWKADTLSRLLGSLPELTRVAYNFQPVDLWVENNGAAPATNLRISIQSFGNAALFADTAPKHLWNCLLDEVEDKKKVSYPRPIGISRPWRLQHNRYPDLTSMISGVAAPFRDRYAIERTSDDDNEVWAGSEICFECKDFRHDGQARRVSFGVFSGFDSTGDDGIEITATAENMRDVVRIRIPLSLSLKDRPILPLAEKIAAHWGSSLPQFDFED